MHWTDIPPGPPCYAIGSSMRRVHIAAKIRQLSVRPNVNALRQASPHIAVNILSVPVPPRHPISPQYSSSEPCFDGETGYIQKNLLPVPRLSQKSGSERSFFLYIPCFVRKGAILSASKTLRRVLESNFSLYTPVTIRIGIFHICLGVPVLSKVSTAIQALAVYSLFSVLIYITPSITRMESAPGKLSISR